MLNTNEMVLWRGERARIIGTEGDGKRVTHYLLMMQKCTSLVTRWVPVTSKYLVPTPTVVCLCGSTRFHQAFREANLLETLAGRIVLTIGCDLKSDADLQLAGVLTKQDKERLDELHLRKIDLCDEILVLDVDGYIGLSTAREIEYATSHGKRIRFLSEEKQR